ncbi:MAG TPA: FAD-dependent oxidoreductase [Acholeplasmataceae bacterium]|nr:FAD-dependent oxidoreductase [Acholeplasmataceae bacterium]
MLYKDLVIIGGGPAGLQAAIKAAEVGQDVLIIDRFWCLGGQLIKQTHMFFGSEKQYAKTRGFDIANKLINEINDYKELVTIWINATVLGLYADKVITVYKENEYIRVKAKAIIVATGASERVLAFENNDLPGIYGAGAIQTLMNVYGIKPGSKVLMVGSGNIGLIVSYQLMQAGVQIIAIVEASNKISGYKVHASKIKRLGIDILTSTTIKRAIGLEKVTEVVLINLDQNWEELKGTEKIIPVDGVCIAVGLMPLTNLLAMAGAKMKYIGELGGLVAITNSNFETSLDNVFVCGDASSVEEASSAMVEGMIAGLVASKKLGRIINDYEERLNDYQNQLIVLRKGPFGSKIRNGIEKMVKELC